MRVRGQSVTGVMIIGTRVDGRPSHWNSCATRGKTDAEFRGWLEDAVHRAAEFYQGEVVLVWRTANGLLPVMTGVSFGGVEFEGVAWSDEED